MRQKDPLFRKVNTRARMMKDHDKGSDYSRTRNVKGNKENPDKMKSGVARGLDYTPLFKFLLSKVGKDWDAIYSEAKSRLDKVDPIFWMVAKNSNEMHDNFRVENSYYSRLYVDNDNILKCLNPEYTVNDFEASCHCCTHTFNGQVITKMSAYIQARLDEDKTLKELKKKKQENK